MATRRAALGAVGVAGLVATATLLSGCAGGAEPGVLRLGYFPNLTHAQALYGVHTGLYQQLLGETRLEVQVFNAGPTAFEALLSGRIDAIYAGPSPTISAIEATGGGVVRIISGSASGGASFVLRPDARVADDGDLSGKRFATPQLGNTQDVALKAYLRDHGRDGGPGGDVQVINAPNADILALFAQGEIHGAWVPEPWASRLVLEHGGVVHVDERDLWPGGRFVTTHLVTTRSFLASHEADVRALLTAHLEATDRLASGDAEARATVHDAFTKLTGARLDAAVLERAFSEVLFTDDAVADSFVGQYEDAFELGLAEHEPGDVARHYDLRLRDEARAQAAAAREDAGPAGAAETVPA